MCIQIPFVLACAKSAADIPLIFHLSSVLTLIPCQQSAITSPQVELYRVLRCFFASVTSLRWLMGSRYVLP